MSLRCQLGYVARRVSPAGWGALALVMAAAGCSMVRTNQPARPATTAAAPTAQTAVADSTTPQPAETSAPIVDPKTAFRADATDRQRFQVRLDFGKIFEYQGNFDSALGEYQEALAVAQSHKGGLGSADEAVAERKIAAAYDRLGRFAQAETHYKKALKLNPKDSKIWNNAGYSYYLQGRHADAERALKIAEKLAPDDARIKVNLGLAMAAGGKIKEAMPYLSRSGGDAAAHANLGYLLASTGQTELARQQYQKALEVRPDFEVARRALTVLNTPPHADQPNKGVAHIPPPRHFDPSVGLASIRQAEWLPPLPPGLAGDTR